jgi:hypothetical protein
MCPSPQDEPAAPISSGVWVDRGGRVVYQAQKSRKEPRSFVPVRKILREVPEIVRTCGEDGISLDDERRQERWKKTDKCVGGGGRHIIG